MRSLLLYGALVGGLMAALLVLGRSGLIEQRFIYFPQRELEGDPSALGLVYEDIFFTTRDGVRLHGWFVPGEGDATWLWFHGNAGNISHRLENLKLLHDELGVNVFLFDYRGYGRSQGTPSEQGTYLDGEAAIAYLRSRQPGPESRWLYFGRSLGAAIAVEMATRHPPHGLILESPFPSISYMAGRAYPFLPVSLLLQTHYDSLAKIGKVETPLLVLHGDKDEIVPTEAGRKVFDAARGVKEFYIIRGAGHNDTYVVGGEEYFATLRRFVKGL